jgi:hypothetical protein
VLPVNDFLLNHLLTAFARDFQLTNKKNIRLAGNKTGILSGYPLYAIIGWVQLSPINH